MLPVKACAASTPTTCSFGWWFPPRSRGSADTRGSPALVAKRSSTSLRSTNFGKVAAATGFAFFLGEAMNIAIAELVGKHELRLPLLLAAVLSIASLLVICFTWPSHVKVAEPAPWRDAVPWVSVKRTILTSTNLMLFGIMFFIEGFGMDTLHSAFMVFARKLYHFDTEQCAVFLMLVGVTTPFVMAVILPVLLSCGGELFALRFSSVMLLGVFAVLFLIGLTPYGFLLFLAAPFIPLSHISGSVLLGFATRELPKDEWGRLTGATMAVETCGRLLAPLTAMYVMRRTMDGPCPSAMFLVTAVLMLPGVAIAWWVQPKEVFEKDDENSQMEFSEDEVMTTTSAVLLTSTPASSIS